MKLGSVVRVTMLLALSCGEHAFDAGMTESEMTELKQESGSGDVIAHSINISFIAVEPHEMFVLNPISSARVEEEVNLSKNEIVTQTIIMQSKKRSEQQLVEAKDRKWYSKLVEQTGSTGIQRTDAFVRGRDMGLLDLLLVVDDSNSMQNDHKYLAGNMSSLLQDIGKANWKINIIGVKGGAWMCDHKIITNANKQDYISTLIGMRMRAYNHYSHMETKLPSPRGERALQRAQAALGITNDCKYKWLRPNSTLVALIITDEDHQCANSGAPDNRGNSDNSFYCGTEVRDFISAFEDMRDSTSLYGILEDRATCGKARKRSKCFDYNSTNTGSFECSNTNPCYHIEDTYKLHSGNFLAEEQSFGGISSIRGNKKDYEKILKQISAGIKNKLQDQFTLTEEPSGDIQVTVNNEPSTAFTVEGRILTMMDTGNPEDIIRVTYYTPKFLPFIGRLTVDDYKADLSTLEIKVEDNMLMRGRHYTVSGNTITIQSVRANFPSGSTAYLKWRRLARYEPKQKEFIFTGKREIVAGTVNIPDYDTSRYTFQTNPNRIVFNAGEEPDYGASFKINYEYYHRNKLIYPHNYNDSYPVSAASCDPVPCSFIGNRIVLRNQDFERGKPVTVNLNVQGLKNDRRPMPQHYVPDTLELVLNGEKCTEKELVIKNGELMLKTADAQDNGCTMLATLNNNIDQNMIISYLIFMPKQEVEISTANLNEYAGYSEEVWEVYVAGEKKEEGKDYTINDRKITFTDNYPPDTRGEVRIFIKY